MRLFDPAPGEGQGGGGGDTRPSWASALDVKQDTAAANPPEGQPPAAPSPSGSPTVPSGVPPVGSQAAGGAAGAPPATGATVGSNIVMDEATLQKLVAGVRTAAQPEAPATPPPTQEELDKMFNVFKVTPEMVTQQLGIENPSPEVVAFYNAIAQGSARQAATIASMAIAMEVKRMNEEFAPFRTMINQQFQEKLVNEFFTTYPNLKGYEPLLAKVRDSYLQQGRQFKDTAEAFKTIAEDAASILKSVPGVDITKLLERPAAGANGHQQQAQPTTQATTRMPTLSNGGQGGAGDGNRSGDPKPKWKEALA